ncbi:transcription initiation factor TFIID component TAF4 family-domain-containing protein, partial [Mycena sp. CBHHK59/15]
APQYPAYAAYQQHYQQPNAYQVYQQQQQQQAQQQQASSSTPASDAAAPNDTTEDEKLRTAAPPTRPKLDRSRTQPLNPDFDPTLLAPRLAAIAAHHQLPGGVPPAAAAAVAAALRVRLAALVTQMAVAARHRTDTQFDRPSALYAPGAPMWALTVRSDVAKQVSVLERVERDDETRVRRERKERAEMTAAHAAALAAQAAAGGAGGALDFDGDDDGGKRKKKKDGPGVTARNMSEDVRKKMSNAVASQAAGIGGKYSWMTAGNAAAAASSKPSAGWARPYVPKKAGTAAAAVTPAPVEEDTRTAITIRDAQFVVEKERGHGGGRGSGKGWT